MPAHTDKDILETWKKDRHRGFKMLYERYAPVLFRFIYRFSSNKEHAEEILHDVFTETLKAPLHQEDFHLKAWLFTIAKNKSLNFNRKHRLEVATPHPIEASIAETNLEEEVTTSQLTSKVEKLQDVLPKDLANTWKLRREGMDYQQIAQELDIPLGTVKSRFHRLVGFLRKELKLEP